MTWQEHAACRGMDPKVFFPESREPNGSTHSAKRLYREARQICMGCTVRAACLEQANADGDYDYGMFGGLSPTERRRTREISPAAAALWEAMR